MAAIIADATPNIIPPTNGRVQKPALWAGLLLLASLFTPWWMAWGSVAVGGFPSGGPKPIVEFYFPAFSPFLSSGLGAKIGLHFTATLILLAASIIALVAGAVLRRHPAAAARLAWGSVVLNGMALIGFSVLFPRVGYVGRIFWPWGTEEASELYPGFQMSWVLMPGLFLAAAALYLQARVAFTATPGILAPSLTPSRSGASTRVAAVLLVSAVVGAGLWWGPGTISGVPASHFAREWDLEYKSFEPGEVTVVRGVVTSRAVVSTTYGPYTIVGLDGQASVLALSGDRSVEYSLGASVGVPVHFRTYWYNDIPYTWADEGIAPVPMLTSFVAVFDAVSAVSGIELRYEGGSSPRLVVRTADAFPLDAFNLSVVNVEGPPYVGESVAFGDNSNPLGVVDWMDRLAPGSSATGLVDFTDSNANGVVDSGDFFDLDFPPTVDRHLDSYILRLQGPVSGYGFIPVGDRGPFLIVP